MLEPYQKRRSWRRIKAGDLSYLDEQSGEWESLTMRVATVLVAVFVAWPAHAGTVTSLSFVGADARDDVVANGVAATSISGFVLYRHGQWAVAAAAEPTPPPLDASSEAAATQAPAPLLVATCAARSLPWRSGLLTRTVLARAVYWPIVRDAECRHALPGGLLDALVLQESRYRPAVVSRAGAGGLAQLMPATAADLGVRNRFDPVASVEAGARYLRSMLDRYNSVPLALAAYNAGPGAVDRTHGIPPNAETPGYVRRVIGLWTQASPTLIGTSPLSRAVSLSFSGPSSE